MATCCLLMNAQFTIADHNKQKLFRTSDSERTKMMPHPTHHNDHAVAASLISSPFMHGGLLFTGSLTTRWLGIMLNSLKRSYQKFHK